MRGPVVCKHYIYPFFFRFCVLNFCFSWRVLFSVYEGVDYSNKANRADAAGGAVPFQFIDTGKRERKKIASYKEDNFYRQQQAAAVKKRTMVRATPRPLPPPEKSHPRIPTLTPLMLDTQY